MSRPRNPRSARIATAAILALTLILTAPAFAAGPFTDLGDTLTSWARTWLAPLLGAAPNADDLQERAPASHSSRSIGQDVPVLTATDGSGPCELGCPEAGAGGDPNG